MPITIDGSNGVTFPDTTTLASGAVAGRLLRAPQILTSGTSYTTPTGCNNILIEMVGAGGGGGGAAGANGASGGGGGGGPYAVKYAAVSPSTSYTIAIGSGGTAGTTTTAGGTGGTTSITIGATTYSITGGGGGAFVNTGVTGVSGSSGTATNFDSTIAAYNSGTSIAGGYPNLPFFPASNNAGVSSQNKDAVSYGGGGRGGSGVSGTPGAGGAGFQGMIRIWEYA